MIIDLAILGVIGMIVEGIGIYAFNVMINAWLMATAISLLIILVAVTRWEWYGLVLAPILPIATIISGRFLNVHDAYAEYYTWQFYLAIVLSLIVVGVIINLWLKKIGVKKTFKSFPMTLGLCGSIILCFVLALSTFYLLFENRFMYLSFVIWNAFGYLMLIVGVFLLNGQGILQNVKQSMLEQKQDMLEEEYFEFNLEEAEFNEKEGDFKNEQSN